ncbi:MAG TPA: hypothetical protein VFA18_18675, partial [Gemmataceae bacterium]|nr:hypothetical protein [Gemmataceae bacterium]
GNALYVIGTPQAYNVLKQAQSTLAKRVGDASLHDVDMDNPPPDIKWAWKLANHFADLLDRPWRFKPRAVAPRDMTVAQLREHVQSLAARLATAERNLQTAEEAYRNFDPGSSMATYWRGMIRGFHETIPNLELELSQARQLLEAKQRGTHP